MCDGREFVEAKWNCVFSEGFAIPNGGSIFGTGRGALGTVPGGVICQDSHAPWDTFTGSFNPPAPEDGRSVAFLLRGATNRRSSVCPSSEIEPQHL